MKIERQEVGPEEIEEVRRRLEELVRPGTDEPVCGSGCPRAAPRNCCRACPEISKVLSSDPDNFPLEPRVAPLVFELKRLGVFESCWSCEGHDKPDGTPWKVPRIWFYADSVVHLRVLAKALADLRLAGQLNAAWQLVATYTDDRNIGTTFSLEPIPGTDCGLAQLQGDLDTMAAHLNQAVGQGARKLQASIDTDDR